MIRRWLPVGALAVASACARPDPQAFWTALSAADPAAARAAAATDTERRCANALEAALTGGSGAATADLLALGADPGAGAGRDWARRLLLHLLRIEGQWQRLANLHRDHPELELTENSVPAGMRPLRRADVAAPETAVRLGWLENASGHAIVEARLTGDRTGATLPIALDTGAALCAVTETLAEQLGVRFLGDAPLPVPGIAGQTASGRSAILPELALGPWTLRDLPLAVMPSLPEVSALVGWDVLQHVAMELSPRERTIVVGRSRGVAPDSEPNLVLLTEPLLRLRCGGTPILLLLDTGANTTYVTREVTARLGLPTKPGGSQAIHGVGGETEVEVDLVALQLRCGKTQFSLGDLPAHDRAPTPRGLPRIDGGIGMDLLSAVHVVIDGPARTLTMREQ